MEYKKETSRKFENLENLNFVKAILMLLVVLYHSIVIWDQTDWFNQAPADSSIILGGIAGWLNSFHIYAFILVSGYLYAYIKFDQKGYRTFDSYLINKVKRLLVPYAFVAITWCIPWHIVYFGYNQVDLVQKYILACAPEQLWFLWMLFVVFIFAFILGDFLYNDIKLGIIISILLYVIGFLFSAVIGHYFRIGSGMQCFYLFYAGMLLKKKGFSKILRVPLLAWIVLDIVLFVISRIGFQIQGMIGKLVNAGVGFGLHLVGAVMVTIILLLIANSVNWQASKVIGFLLKHNFVIYLFHQQVIYGVITLLNGKVPSVILAFVNFVVGIAISSVISIVLHKWKVSRILIGEKA